MPQGSMPGREREAGDGHVPVRLAACRRLFDAGGDPSEEAIEDAVGECLARLAAALGPYALESLSITHPNPSSTLVVAVGRRSGEVRDTIPGHPRWRGGRGA